MSIQIRNGDKVLSLKCPVSPPDTERPSVFTLESQGLDDVLIPYPLYFIDDYYETNLAQYELILFKSKYSLSDKNVIQLFLENTDNKNAIGFISPIEAFYDNKIGADWKVENDMTAQELEAIVPKTKNFKDIKIFLNHIAFPIFSKLLREDKHISKIVEYRDMAEYKFKDFFPENTVVLCYDKDKWNTITNRLKVTNNWEHYYPFLYENGFAPITKDTDYNDISFQKEVKHPWSDKSFFSKVVIKPITPKIQVNDKYTIELFKNVLKVDLHPVVRFHFLYQVIELLINDKGVADFKIKFIQECQTLHNITTVYDIEKTIWNGIKPKGEGERIADILTAAKITDITKYNNLMNNTIAAEAVIAKQLYAIRNKIVHGYHNLLKDNPNIDTEITKINHDFESLIVDILTQYT